jgi:hypothetical protein
MVQVIKYSASHNNFSFSTFFLGQWIFIEVCALAKFKYTGAITKENSLVPIRQCNIASVATRHSSVKLFDKSQSDKTWHKT